MRHLLLVLKQVLHYSQTSVMRYSETRCLSKSAMGEIIWKTVFLVLLKFISAITAEPSFGNHCCYTSHLTHNMLCTDSTIAMNLLRHIRRWSCETFPFTGTLFPLVTITRMFSQLRSFWIPQIIVKVLDLEMHEGTKYKLPMTFINIFKPAISQLPHFAMCLSLFFPSFRNF
jgi:hypothetical protein